MEKAKKLFGNVNLTWTKLIVFAIIAGVYTAVMALLPITYDTSFRDIAITFEVWILFGIFIIMNSKSSMDSALKCFVFFLISQPLVYLVQVPFSSLGWGLFNYYRYWFIWTLLCLPMGYIGYYIKKDKWWGLLILTPILILLGFHYAKFLGELSFSFPGHLLSAIFCFITLLLYPLCMFNNKKIRKAGVYISVIIILIMTVLSFSKSNTYKTDILISGGETNAVFNDKYKVYLEDPRYGNVSIEYEKTIVEYLIRAEFKKVGKTNLIIEDPNGNKQIYELDIRRDTYDINRKNE